MLKLSKLCLLIFVLQPSFVFAWTADARVSRNKKGLATATFTNNLSESIRCTMDVFGRLLDGTVISNLDRKGFLLVKGASKTATLFNKDQWNNELTEAWAKTECEWATE